MSELPSPRRLLVALDASPESVSALEAAARLAQRWQAELLGLFVEDADLRKLAALHLQGHVGAWGNPSTPLGEEAVEAHLRATAAEARRALLEVAGRLHLPASFRVGQGGVSAAIAEAAAEADLLVLGRPSAHAPRLRVGRTAPRAARLARVPVLLLPHGSRLRWPVLALFSPHTPACLLDHAASLARASGAELRVLVAAEDERTADLLQERAGQQLAPGRDAVRFGRTIGPVERVARQLRSLEAWVLVLCATSAVLGGTRDILDEAPGPVLLVPDPLRTGPAGA